MQLIYGSTAIKYWFSDFKRIPHDLDIISNEGNTNSKGIEYYWIDSFNFLNDNNINNEYVDPDFLYTIKISHLSWDINWDKHMKDLIFLKSKGCKINMDFYNALIKEWNLIHGKKNVKMNVANNGFFKENIKRKYNHDWLHEQYAFYDRPLNESIRYDLDNPLCSIDLWNKLSYEDKLKCALEELYVLTSERYIFVDKPMSIKYAKVKMLKQMITSTTSGWFNLFLKENFLELLNENSTHIIEKINKLKNEE